MKNNFIIINKKGDLPVTVLVLGVFILCMFAVFSFIHSINQFNDSLKGIESMDSINSKTEEYYFYKELGKSEKELEEMFDIHTDSSGRKYVYIEKKGKIYNSFESWFNEKTLFSVKYYLD